MLLQVQCRILVWKLDLLIDFVVEDQKQISLRKLVFRLRKPMNVYIGWRCCRKQEFFLLKDSRI